jgi:hypothetical protein
MNCSITIAIFVAGLKVGLLPVIRDPKIYKAGISIGKLKGAMIATGPYGHL